MVSPIDEFLKPTSLTGGGRSIPHPEDDGDAWDTLILGNFAMPGIWTVDGFAERVIDVKKPKGQDGARFKDEGYKPSDLMLVGQIIDRTEWKTMTEALKDIHPRKKGSANEPLACEHPALAYLGVSNVYVTKVFGPRVRDGIIEVRIAVLEWVPKPKVKKKPKDSPKAQRLANLTATQGQFLFREPPPPPKPSEGPPNYVTGDTSFLGGLGL